MQSRFRICYLVGDVWYLAIPFDKNNNIIKFKSFSEATKYISVELLKPDIKDLIDEIIIAEANLNHKIKFHTYYKKDSHD